MLLRKLLKGEDMFSHVMINSITRNTTTNNSGSMKRSQSLMDVVHDVSPLSSSLSSPVQKNNFKKFVMRRKFLPISIYDNFNIHRVDSYDLYEKHKFRKINQLLKQQKQDELNSIYRTNLKTSFMKRFGSIYLTATNNNNNNNQNISSHQLHSTPLYKEHYTIKHNSFDFDNVNDTTTNNNNSNNNVNCRYKCISSSSSPLNAHNPVNHYKPQNKIQLKIGELYGNKDTPLSLVKSSKQILLLKSIIAEQQMKLLNKKSEQRSQIEELEQQMYWLNYNKKLLINGYINMYDQYLDYLRKMILHEKDILDKLNDTRMLLQFDVDKLLERIERSYTLLQEEIQMRDFLVHIKEKKRVLPLYYVNKSKQEQQTEMLGVFFTKQMKSKVNEMLILNILKQYEDMLHKQKVAGDNGVGSVELSNEDKQRYDEYFDKNKKIFVNSEMLFNYIESFETKNILLLKDLDKRRGIVLEHKQTLTQLVNEVKQYETLLSKHLHEKEKQLLTLKHKHKTLLYKKSSLSHNLHNNIKRRKALSLSPQSSSSSSLNKSSFITNDLLCNMQYHNINSKYPIDFSLLKYKLNAFIEGVLALSYSEFTYRNVLMFIKEDDYDKIKTMKIVAENEHEIRSSCVMLLKVYEYVVKVVLARNCYYNNHSEFAEQIRMLVNQNVQRKKLEHARLVRKIIKQKQENTIKEINDKVNKVLFINKRKCIDGRDYIMKERRMKKERKVMMWKSQEEKKDKKENSFEEYVIHSEGEEEGEEG